MKAEFIIRHILQIVTSFQPHFKFLEILINLRKNKIRNNKCSILNMILFRAFLYEDFSLQLYRLETVLLNYILGFKYW